MDEIEKNETEAQEEVYVARHAKEEEEPSFADVENFDVEDTEPVKAEKTTENTADEPKFQPDVNNAENFDVHSDNYGDDFDYQSVGSKEHVPSDNPTKSNKDYGDGFDSQTGESRREYKHKKPNNAEYYEEDLDTDDYHGKPKKHKGSKKSKKKSNKATVACVVVAVVVIVVCVLVFVLSKCSFSTKKPVATTAPTTKAVVTTQEPTTEYYEPETEPEYVPDYTEYVEETDPPVTEEYTEPETEPYTEEYTEPETYEPTPDTEPQTEYVPDETTQIV